MRTLPLLGPVALTLAAAAVLPCAAPALARGDSVRLDVGDAPGGHVRAQASWADDRTPVSDGFDGTLAATAPDGRSAGPWQLVGLPDWPGTYTTREALPAGHWRISVGCAQPAPGRGERELDVEAVSFGVGSAEPSSVLPLTAAARRPAHESTDEATTWAAVGTATAAVLLVTTGLWLRRRPRW
ncbi:hypothetical protein [Streptomyces sp. NRRL WC-3742]|uniref:hypothetical protein n=1 Tax=Streptomyces sp. NRRL WC-3742 TaxID=1463934 RepID=UPI0004CB51BD|nr:hypothetical protein [Streptomyces sp. NRRL WC-3742]